MMKQLKKIIHAILLDKKQIKMKISDNNYSLLVQQIVKHEGEEQYAYNDSRGYVTIGIGRNIDRRCENGLSKDEIYYLLNNDLRACIAKIDSYIWYINSDEIRQGVLIELCFNMGLDNLLKFHDFLNFMQQKNYVGASQSLLDSAWSKEVQKTRVDDIIARLKNGIY